MALRDGFGACKWVDLWCPERSGLHCHVDCLTEASCYGMDVFAVDGLGTGVSVDCVVESHCDVFDILWPRFHKDDVFRS